MFNREIYQIIQEAIVDIYHVIFEKLVDNLYKTFFKLELGEKKDITKELKEVAYYVKPDISSRVEALDVNVFFKRDYHREKGKKTDLIRSGAGVTGNDKSIIIRIHPAQYNKGAIRHELEHAIIYLQRLAKSGKVIPKKDNGDFRKYITNNMEFEQVISRFVSYVKNKKPKFSYSSYEQLIINMFIQYLENATPEKLETVKKLAKDKYFLRKVLRRLAREGMNINNIVKIPVKSDDSEGDEIKEECVTFYGDGLDEYLKEEHEKYKKWKLEEKKRKKEFSWFF